MTCPTTNNILLPPPTSTTVDNVVADDNEEAKQKFTQTEQVYASSMMTTPPTKHVRQQQQQQPYQRRLQKLQQWQKYQQQQRLHHKQQSYTSTGMMAPTITPAFSMAVSSGQHCVTDRNGFPVRPPSNTTSSAPTSYTPTTSTSSSSSSISVTTRGTNIMSGGNSPLSSSSGMIDRQRVTLYERAMRHQQDKRGRKVQQRQQQPKKQDTDQVPVEVPAEELSARLGGGRNYPVVATSREARVVFKSVPINIWSSPPSSSKSTERHLGRPVSPSPTMNSAKSGWSRRTRHHAVMLRRRQHRHHQSGHHRSRTLDGEDEGASATKPLTLDSKHPGIQAVNLPQLKIRSEQPLPGCNDTVKTDSILVAGSVQKKSNITMERIPPKRRTAFMSLDMIIAHSHSADWNSPDRITRPVSPDADLLLQRKLTTPTTQPENPRVHRETGALEFGNDAQTVQTEYGSV